MKTIKIGPHTILVGIHWLASQASTKKDAINESLSDAPLKKYGIVLEDSIDYFAIGSTEKKERAIVGAAWITESQKKRDDADDFILIEPLENDQFWLCAIKNGLPFYGSDIISDIESIATEVSKLYEDGKYSLLTTSDIFAERFGNKSDNPNCTSYRNIGFEALIEGGGNKFKVKSLKGEKIKTLLLMIAALGLLAAYFLWNEYEDYAAMQEAVFSNSQQTKAKEMESKRLLAAAEDGFNKTKNAMLEEKLTAIQESLTNKSGNKVSYTWAETIWSMKLSTNGWDYSKGICDHNGCSFLLEPRKGATNIGLFSAFKDASLDNSNGSAEIGVHRKLTKNSIKIDDLWNGGIFTVKGISQFQILKGYGFPIEFSPLKEVKIKVELPQVMRENVVAASNSNGNAINSNPSFKTIPVGILEGEFKISGKSLWALSNISSQLTAPGIVYERLEIEFNRGDFISIKSWHLKGNYYAKP